MRTKAARLRSSADLRISAACSSHDVWVCMERLDVHAITAGILCEISIKAQAKRHIKALSLRLAEIGETGQGAPRRSTAGGHAYIAAERGFGSLNFD